MKRYIVTGMNCAACSARVERAVRDTPGVTSCAVNLLTGEMSVEGSVDESTVIAAVVAAGYGASLLGKRAPTSGTPGAKAEMSPILRRLLFSLPLLGVLLYLSMGYGMFSAPLPAFMAENPLVVALCEMLLATAVMLFNYPFFVSGARALWHRSPNMDSLVALGSGAAFVYSTCLVFRMALYGATASRGIGGLYYESAAMIVTLITVGKLLEARAKGKTTDALRALARLSPDTVTLVRDGAEMICPTTDARVGDVFVLRPGERASLDGVVIEGASAMDESALTGESMPVDKAPGDEVRAGGINTSGYLRVRATRVGDDTALARIIRMVRDASLTKAPIAKVADRVSAVFVPAVMAIAAIVTIVWIIVRADVGFALARGISVLVISCPCALGLATPVAIMVGSGVGARRGILFKTAASLEMAGRVQTVVLDKTGTLTVGDLCVTDRRIASGADEAELLSVAASLEARSEHPVARAVTRAAEEAGITPLKIEAFEALPGRGLCARREEKILRGGSADFVGTYAPIPDDVADDAVAFADAGKTPLYFAEDDRLLGVLAVADRLRPDSREAICDLHAMGLTTVMLSGDNERTARAVAAACGIRDVIAGVLPDGKQEVIQKFKEKGRVAMVGDGINDAPSLTSADLGVAVGAGSDVAIDAADVVLTRDTLTDVCAALRLGRATLKNIRENLFWAFFYNVIGIPIAAGVLAPVGLTLSPMIGAAAMSLSSFFVVSNALRLNLCKIDPKEKESDKMHYELKVEGMMCPHCEAHMKEALEKLPFVTEAKADHTTGRVTVEATSPVAEDVFRKTVGEAGYRYIGM